MKCTFDLSESLFSWLSFYLSLLFILQFLVIHQSESLVLLYCIM